MPAQIREPHDVGNINLNFRKFPRHVRDQFKSYCSRRGSDMITEVIRLMKEASAVDEKLKVHWNE